MPIDDGRLRLDEGAPVDLSPQWRERIAGCLAEERYTESLRLSVQAMRQARRQSCHADSMTPTRDAAVFLAWALYRMRRYGGCRRWLTHAMATGLVAADDAECNIISLWLLLEQGAHSEALARAEAALAAMQGQVSFCVADCFYLRGRALTLLGRISEAGESLETAVALFRLVGSHESVALACNALGALQTRQGRYAAGRDWLARSASISEQLGLEVPLARTRLNLAILGYKTGDYPTAKRDCEAALAVFERFGNPTSACRAHLVLAIIERLGGQYAAARRHLMEAHTVARRLRLKREQCLVLEFLGDVFRDEGRPAEARRYYARGLAIARAIAPEGDLMVELLRRDGECRTLQGDPARGLAILDKALAAALRLGDRFETGVILRCRAAAMAAMGDHTGALAQVEAAIARLEEIEARHELAIAHLLAAELLSARPEDQQRESSRDATA